MQSAKGLRRRLEQRGVRPSSAAVYAGVIKRAGPAAEDPEKLTEWLRTLVGPDVPLGSVLPRRAAVKHFLTGALGLSDDEADDLLPPARGIAPRPRSSLTKTQLSSFFEAAAGYPSKATRMILRLLPYTGLRISEACALRVEDCVIEAGRRGFDVRGKGGKARFVVLPAVLYDEWDAYLAQKPESEWVFPGKGTFVGLTPAAVRLACREIRAADPSLGRVSPHVLRHTWATHALRASVSLREVQEILGHASITTTAIYTHPTAEDLATAMDKVDLG
jgi:integrase/recombinase XerD